MAKSPNQKTKLLCLYRMLLRQTDEEHPLTVLQIIEELARQDIKAWRPCACSGWTSSPGRGRPPAGSWETGSLSCLRSSC